MWYDLNLWSHDHYVWFEEISRWDTQTREIENLKIETVSWEWYWTVSDDKAEALGNM